jgi:hypothetical protein
MMRRSLSKLTLALALAVVAAGCYHGGGALDNSASLNYAGSGGGSDEDQASCNDDGQLTMGGTIGQGRVMVTVTDGNGAQIFQQEFSGNVDTETESLNGAAGTWTLRGERSSDFDGSYTVTLGC